MKVAPYQIDSFIESISKNNNICCAVVYGPESGLVSIRAQKIAKLIVENLTDPFLVTNISQKQIAEDKGLLIDEFYAIPMLGGRKLITLNCGNEITETMKSLFGADSKIKNPLKENFILISAGELDKNSSLRNQPVHCLHGLL
jgi:DNA polymerase-3 subunit delta